jgi:hypothetical protein
MTKLYSLNIRWVKTPISPEIVDVVLSEAGDWLRFDGWSWLVYTPRTAHDITNALRPKLSPEDGILIIACDANDYSGFAQQWVWDWINKYRTPQGGLGGFGIPNPLSIPERGLGMVPTGNALSALAKALSDASTKRQGD